MDLVNDVLSEKDGGKSFGNQSITSSTGGSNLFAMLKQTFRSAINGLNMATGQKSNTYTEEHHILSNKNSKYSPQYQEIMDRYDMTLNAKENIISLSGHRGRHTNAYNETMLYLLRATDDYANGNQVLFQKGFGMIRQTIIDNPWIPYARYK